MSAQLGSADVMLPAAVEFAGRVSFLSCDSSALSSDRADRARGERACILLLIATCPGVVTRRSAFSVRRNVREKATEIFDEIFGVLVD